jgi:hypothetical protein
LASAIFILPVFIVLVVYRNYIAFDPVGFLNEFTKLGIILLGMSLIYFISVGINTHSTKWKMLKTADNKLDYQDKMKILSSKLNKASHEVDSILEEIASISESREKAVAELEKKSQELAIRESELKDRISNLEKVPLPAVDYFLKVLEKGDRRSALRDYSLFGLGVIVSTAVSIILKYVFGM